MISSSLPARSKLDPSVKGRSRSSTAKPNSSTQLVRRSTGPLAVAPTLEHFDLIALTFQALSDATRLRIIWALAAGEQSVTQLVLSLGVSQPAVSHHLRMLRNLRLVKVRRSGRHSNYVLDDGHIDRLLKEALAHVEEFL